MTVTLSTPSTTATLSYSSPEQPLPLHLYVAFLGIDWADRKHDIALRAAGSDDVELTVIEHTPEALDQWAAALQRRFNGPIAIAVELNRGPLINALMKYSCFTIFPVPPARLASYRSAFSSSGAKDDPADAELILDYLQKHTDQLRPFAPEDDETRKLRLFCENRRNLIELQIKLSNRLTSALKLYFPQVLAWLLCIRAPIACAFLKKWLTLEAFQRAKPATIRNFFHAHNSRSQERIDRIINERRIAVPLTTDAVVIEAASLDVMAMINQLKPLAEAIAELEAQINALFDKHPDAAIFKSFPGAGEALAPRLLVAMGTDRGRYSSPAEVQSFSGIAPVTIRSGRTTDRVRRRYACPTFMKQSFHEFAMHTLQRSDWARAYYDQLRARGAKHQAAVRALAYKWIRIIFACWRDRVPYDEAHYMQALRNAGSPLVSLCPSPCEEAVTN